MKAINCKTEYRNNPIGIDAQDLYVSWQCQEGIMQSAYQIVVKKGSEIILDTGKVESKKMHAIIAPEHRSRDNMSWTIRLWDQDDCSGEWADGGTFEYGLLNSDDWYAKWIEPSEEIGYQFDIGTPDYMNSTALKAWNEKKHKKNEVFLPHKPASVFRKKFCLDSMEKIETARVYASACGLYEIYINGQKITDYVLTPGTANYKFEIPYQTYDVSNYVKTGENEIHIILGDGWYRSTSGVDGDRNLFGEKTAVICQLEINGKAIVSTDNTWQASQNGPLRQNDMQHGEVYDARMENLSDDEMAWHEVKEVPIGYELLKAMDTVPILRMERFDATIIKTPKGDTVLDFGQNLAGQIELIIPNGAAGEKIRLIHGETLDQNGEFTQENFQDRKRHKEGGTYQTIDYTMKAGYNHYHANFTIMGFRYVKVETNADLSKAVFYAHAVYSQMMDTLSLTTSNTALNQLVKNAMWSQKGNFCDIPTDCPTRERAGWTGDAGIFAYTGLRLMESVPVLKKWLRQCRYTQLSDGRVMNIAPPNNKPGFFAKLLAGSVAWGDAIIIVPWEIYQLTGDKRVLSENYSMMCNWYSFLKKEARKKKLFNKSHSKKNRNYVIEKGMNYGEWCEPGRSAAESMKDGNYDVANAYFAYSGMLMSKIAKILDRPEAEVNELIRVSEKARQGYIEVYTKNGLITTERQCQLVRPLAFGLLHEEADKLAAKQLAVMVKRENGKLNTGFLTTPEICRQLAKRGYIKEAYQLLLNPQMPGWLYEVNQGATTLWENWDGIQPGKEPKASLNHYSYGAVVGWIMDGVCGIHYCDGELVIQPEIYIGDDANGLTSAKATYDSPAGKIEMGWEYINEKVHIHLFIPVGLEAKLILPNGTQQRVLAGEYNYMC
jgi:alpha-L-rhamnosidase